MTTMSRSDVIPLSTAIQSRNETEISDRMVKFLAEDLIPLMAGLWPKSANQLNSNLRGNAIAFGVMLTGLSANEIRNAVIALARNDPDREFAPPPQELKRLCFSGVEQELKQVKFIASMTSLEMQVCVKCLNGEIDKTQQAVDTEINKLIELVHGKGGEVSGERGFPPLISLIQG